MREIDNPRSAPDGQRVTMEQAGEEFSHRLELRGRRKSHRLTVASDLRNHIGPFFAGKTLDRIRPADIERYVEAKRKALAIKTIRNHVNTMHSVFELGLRKGWCQINPVKLADRPTVKKTETRIQFLDQTELEKLLDAPYPDDAFGRIEPTLYLTAAMTGLRLGELLGLRWRDVDFDARKLRVVSPFVRGEFGDPKSSGSGRSVPMAERVAVGLHDLGVLRPRSRSCVLPPRDREAARPLEARPPLQAGAGPSRGPPDHLPRATPHLRDPDGGGGHADEDAPVLDGPRRLEDDADLCALPAERSGSQCGRSGVRVIERSIVGEATTADGILVVVFANTWRDHILDPDAGHAELAPHLDAVLSAIAAPDHREPDERPHRERFFKRDAGPSRWLMVVVDFEEQPARVVTALGYGHGRSPAGWMP
jgi:integrase